MIERYTSNEDLRIKNVKLTEKSMEKFDGMKNMFKKINDVLLEGIYEGDLNTFLIVLNRMKSNLNNMEGENYD